MHRTTPLAAAFRSYSAGGARSVVHSVDDTTLMQNMKGNFMAGESRDNIEAPQNYGFTSVTMDADQGSQSALSGGGGNVGAIGQKSGDGPETFISFMGGNRSFPVAGNIDDRRHRLYKLDKGDVAMFRTRDDKQQFHMATDGGFWSGPNDKTLRMALLDQSSGQSQQQGGGSGGGSGAARSGVARDFLHVATRDTSGGGNGSSSGAGQGGQQKGQQSLKQDNQSAKLFFDLTNAKTRMAGKECHSMLDDGVTYMHVASDKQVYQGAEKTKAKFAKIVTTAGPCINVWGHIG